MLVSSEDALDQVIRFDRTIGYPDPMKNRDGWQRLLTSLTDACNKYGVPPDRLVTACLEASKHCPTDYDLLSFASGLRDVEPWTPPTEPGDCPNCAGTGWHTVYSLHTKETRGAAGHERSFTRKETITAAAYESFNGGRLDPRTQTAYSGVKRCPCGAVPKGQKV